MLSSIQDGVDDTAFDEAARRLGWQFGDRAYYDAWELRRRLAAAAQRAADAVIATFKSLAAAFSNVVARVHPELHVGRRNDQSSLIESRIRLGADRRRHPPGSQAREQLAPGTCTRAHQRLLGGRQSYARVRCDRRRAVIRAERSGR